MSTNDFYVVDLESHSNQLSLWWMPLTDLNPERACNVPFKQFFPQGALQYVRGEDRGSFYASLPTLYAPPHQPVSAINATLHLGTSSDSTLRAFQGFSVSSLESDSEKYYELRLFPFRGQPLEARARGTHETNKKRGAVIRVPLADAYAVGQITLIRDSDYAHALDLFQQRISLLSLSLPQTERQVNAAILLGKHPSDCFDHYVLYGHVQIS